MSEKIHSSRDMRVINRMTIEIDSPQQLRELANRLEIAERDRFLPGEITIEVTPSIDIRYNPTKPIKSFGLRMRESYAELSNQEVIASLEHNGFSETGKS